MRVMETLKYVALVLMLGGAGAALPTTPAISDSEVPMRLQSELRPPPQDTSRYYPDPEAGSFVGDAYTNAYFGLSLPLPLGWTEGLAGPPPSGRGLYVLASMDGTKVDHATLLIVAQDLFFSAKPLADVADVAADFRVSLGGIPDLSIDSRPADVTLAGQAFLRLDYHAGGLYRGWLATELRCHVVSFNITATDQATVDRIADLLQTISPPAQSDAATGTNAGATRTIPVCIKDYVTAQTTIHRVEPAGVDLNGLRVPVRIIIGADGKVEHVHVISATPAQRQAIEGALRQWEFRPFELMGHPTEVETGLTFEFKSHRP
jgi:Gram-negative bacterial TonB protein C-terminal